MARMHKCACGCRHSVGGDGSGGGGSGGGGGGGGGVEQQLSGIKRTSLSAAPVSASLCYASAQMQPDVSPVSEPSVPTFAQQLLTAACNASNTPMSLAFGASPQISHSTLSPSNSVTPSQKDFAIALGVSQARISQLVKIGMPLSRLVVGMKHY
jgi:hypothetical protein